LEGGDRRAPRGIFVTAAGGWFYFRAARESLRNSDRQHAARLAQSLGIAAQHHLREKRDRLLQRLVSDFLRNDCVRYVALLDRDGTVVAAACRDANLQRWSQLVRMPLSVSTVQRAEDDVLVLARPIVLRDAIWWEHRMVGAVRMVFDTAGTTARLRTVRKRMLAIAAAIALCGIPLGYLLVWHMTVRPVRALVAVTGRLAKGDFAARAGIRRADEIGRLGRAFDGMAGELTRMRDELLEANEQLERKVAERTQALQVANRRLRDEMDEKEEFLRAVSHDLHAPLRNIAGMATLAMMKWRDELPEEVLARLQRIQANVDAETSLIGELLELSRIRSCPQKRELVDMGRLVAALAETFDYELKSRRIQFYVADELPTLYVERSRIRQVFQNLIDNAVKYMHRPEGGWIRIGCRRRDGLHEFSVADNGPGIPPEQQQRIFCVFRRATTAAAAGVQGKGVGLALVKTVLANYDGRAWVQSVPGQGATFFVALDARNTAPPQDEPDDDAVECTETAEAGCHPVGG
jgi:signal transduction histidine kinase